MNITYQLQLDFDQPIQEFTDLKLLFEVLKHDGHIFIYDASTQKYQQMAKESVIDPSARPLYVETSVSTEGDFVPNIETWIKDYMIGEFYNPEKRPHIETYLP